MSQLEIKQDKKCGNCNFFQAIENEVVAIDTLTGEEIASGERGCSAGNIAWADSPCVTGQFLPKVE